MRLGEEMGWKMEKKEAGNRLAERNRERKKIKKEKRNYSFRPNQNIHSVHKSKLKTVEHSSSDKTIL